MAWWPHPRAMDPVTRLSVVPHFRSGGTRTRTGDTLIFSGVIRVRGSFYLLSVFSPAPRRD